MRVVLCFCINLCAMNIMFGQDFVANFYFEDSDGRRDTITVVDPSIGGASNEENILGQDLDSFDVRFVEYTRDDPSSSFLFWDCEHIAGEVSFNDENLFNSIDSESKEYIQNAPFCDEERFAGLIAEFFIPINSSYPIEISWDDEIFQDSCRSNSFISELPRSISLTDTLWCEDRIVHPRILLKNSNSIILQEPNFLTFNRLDDTIVSVYTLFVSSTNWTGSVLINTSEVKESGISIFPNPAQDKIILDTPEQDSKYQILNLQGQRVMQGQYRDYIGVAELRSGIYFLQLERAGEKYRAIKFIKE